MVYYSHIIDHCSMSVTRSHFSNYYWRLVEKTRRTRIWNEVDCAWVVDWERRAKGLGCSVCYQVDHEWIYLSVKEWERWSEKRNPWTEVQCFKVAPMSPVHVSTLSVKRYEYLIWNRILQEILNPNKVYPNWKVVVAAQKFFKKIKEKNHDMETNR